MADTLSAHHAMTEPISPAEDGNNLAEAESGQQEPSEGLLRESVLMGGDEIKPLVSETSTQEFGPSLTELSASNVDTNGLKVHLNEPVHQIELEAIPHASAVLTELQALLREQILCDVRLTTEAGGVSAHKLVLMATSPSLRLRLATGDMSNELIHFDNIPLSLLEAVVHFMYTGKLNFESSCFDQLLKFCEDLELSLAVSLLKDYTDNYDADDLEEDSSFLYNKNYSDSRSKLPSTKSIQTKSKDGSKRSDREVSAGKNNKTNRRVKQSPKKRRAKSPVVDSKDVAETVPDKLLKLSSEALIQNVLEQKVVKEEPVEYRGRGRPKKNCVRQSTKKRKATKRKTSKSSYVSKKEKKENDDEDVELDENGEKVYDFTKTPIERSKTSRREVNALKSVISTNAKKVSSPPYTEMSPVKDLKQEKVSDDENTQDFGGDTETEQGTMDSKEPLVIKKKRIWKKRKKQPCSMCDKVLSTKKRLVFHEFCQHGIDYDRTKYKMFHCPVEGCGHISSSRNNMRTHTRSRHSEDRPHICEFCGKSFKLQSGLQTHLNVHTGAKVYECKQCGERFNQHAGLDIHIKRHHLGAETWQELCHLCSEKFLRKIELAWHLFREHKLPLPERYKAYICDKCDFVSKSVQDFERHKNAHAGIKEWVCNICSKGCATKSELKRHVMYHGEKKFKCTYANCSYACVDDVGLQKHIQLNHTHKHFKPYVCSVCKYKTGVKGNLDKHIRQVHNLEVVSKHTVPLKTKYKDFQQGDIITKDMQLVVTVQEREKLYKEELALLQCSEFKDAEDTRIKQITKTYKTAAERKKPTRPSQSQSLEDLTLGVRTSASTSVSANESADATANLESEYGIPLLHADKYQKNPTSLPQNSFQAEMNAPLFGSHMFTHNQSIPPHMAMGLGAQDLRMGLAAHLAGPHMYPEDLQAYADAAMDHISMNK